MGSHRGMTRPRHSRSSQLASRENLTMIPTTIAYRKASGGASRYRTTPTAKRIVSQASVGLSGLLLTPRSRSANPCQTQNEGV